ncbi:helix-turn-helix domain-containing protein [Spirosoma rigui]|uniref:helix-turn-helix domain-containing protein n=1 Tax=Spirosoma rigui TaxID=564064 RepID=UPI0009AF3F5B|nr:helix-turn-helix transcriptional regulator [Spirosoma rigui]
MSEAKQKVGHLIREARVKAGLTQQELGDKLGVGRATVNGYETGKQNLTVDTLEKVAKALGVELKINL